MSGWNTHSLGEVAELIDYGLTASATKQPTGPKFLRITDIQNGSVDWDRVPWCECDARAAADSALEAGDIVFARTGATTGKSFLIRDCPPPAVFASYLIRVRLRAAAEPRYVAHFFQTPAYWAQITKAARGVAQPGVNATVLKRIDVPLPPLREQRRIADILDRAEALREKRRKAFATIDALAHSVFLQVFGDPIVNSKAYERQALGDLVDSARGISYGIVQRGGDVSGGVPVLRIADVVDGRVVPTQVKRTDPNIASRYRRTFLRGGELVISIRGTVGRCAQVPKELAGGNISRELALIPLKPQVSAGFALALLRTDAVQRHIAGDIKGVAQRGINLKDLRQLPVIRPPAAQIEVFTRCSESVESLKLRCEASLVLLDDLFTSLQNRAFRGEL
jgi:type I restriction enzyme, S subunit